MRGPFFVSSTAHLTLIVIAYFGLPNWLAADDLPEQQPIVVELVELAPETIAAALPTKPEPEP